VTAATAAIVAVLRADGRLIRLSDSNWLYDASRGLDVSVRRTTGGHDPSRSSLRLSPRFFWQHHCLQTAPGAHLRTVGYAIMRLQRDCLESARYVREASEKGEY